MKVSAATRSRARHYAMQAIYQWQMINQDIISELDELSGQLSFS